MLFNLSSDIDTTNLDLNSAHNSFLHIPSIKTVTYGNKSLKYLCAGWWNDAFRKGIVINQDVKTNVTLHQIHVSHFKMLLIFLWLLIYPV